MRANLIFDRILTLNLIANTAILCRGAVVFAAFASSRSAATDSYSDPPFAFDATLGINVSHSRRHFSGDAAAVCVSGCIW
jgi:hypothetical protein